LAAIRWSLRALRKIDDILDDLRQYSPRAASAFETELKKTVETLEAFPRSGKVISRYGGSIRDIAVTRYRLIYSLEDEVAFVLLVLHSRQDLQRALRSLPWEERP
jgi:plasmid stabilization system protein ParE